ncbi:hypothetical protein C8D70_10836 [Chryseobacterium sp. CBTAP 102]|uniref:hypothetical protein n=1 Tax=Chryseobacterium sp. CBTAP 102 TaxID=2135644 RepID=UPI000D91430B|nr:hypothetical protein [Chryseobacterium sp. CBTAP 102]PXW13632.1 hypothetical protein C8D70_10836 [Chryseobacterium sp. CBTAP 102]
MDNFSETLKRMHKSSKTLHNNLDFHNSCYLAGYVIECYAKIILGMHHNTSGSTYGHNIANMQREISYIIAHSSLSPYMVDMNINFPKIITGSRKWHPIKRYIESTSQWVEANSIDYQKEIDIAMKKITKMEIDGYTLI